jgi:hypothetical protein
MIFQCRNIFILLAILGIVVGATLYLYGNVVPTTLQGAELSILRLEEWSKWMAGIETAALGGLIYLLFDEKKQPVPLRGIESLFVLLAGAFLGIALLCVASVFSSLSSLALRIHGLAIDDVSSQYDVLEAHMYASSRVWIPVKLGYLVTVHHWLWLMGLLSLGAYVATRIAGVGRKNTVQHSASAPPPHLLDVVDSADLRNASVMPKPE